MLKSRLQQMPKRSAQALSNRKRIRRAWNRLRIQTNEVTGQRSQVLIRAGAHADDCSSYPRTQPRPSVARQRRRSPRPARRSGPRCCIGRQFLTPSTAPRQRERIFGATPPYVHSRTQVRRRSALYRVFLVERIRPASIETSRLCSRLR